VIEKNAWVRAARSRNMPLGAGASNTTHLLMTFSGMLNLSATDKKAIAWGAFVFWNKTFYQTEAVRHTFHEVMDVANLATGGEVDYDPDAANPYDAGYNKSGGNQPIVQQNDVGIPVNGDNVTEEQSQEIELPDNAPKDVLPTLENSPEGKQEDNNEDDSETTTSESPQDDFGIQEKEIYTLNAPITLRGGSTWLRAGVEVMVVSIEDEIAFLNARMNQIKPNEKAAMRVEISALAEAIKG